MSNILLVGDSGTGKTTSLLTLPDTRDVLVVATDPSCEPTLSKMSEVSNGNKICKSHGHMTGGTVHLRTHLAAEVGGWDTLKSYASGSKSAASSKKMVPMLDLIDTLGNYTCELCNMNFGAVDSTPDLILVIDGVSGLNDMAMLQQTQGRSQKTQADWGQAMDTEFALIKMCCSIRNDFILISHLQQMKDEISGAVSLYPDFLGQKLGPRVPRFFNDVVQAVRRGDKFYWSNTSYTAHLRSGLMPLSNSLTPNFSEHLRQGVPKDDN